MEIWNHRVGVAPSELRRKVVEVETVGMAGNDVSPVCRGSVPGGLEFWAARHAVVPCALGEVELPADVVDADAQVSSRSWDIPDAAGSDKRVGPGPALATRVETRRKPNGGGVDEQAGGVSRLTLACLRRGPSVLG